MKCRFRVIRNYSLKNLSLFTSHLSLFTSPLSLFTSPLSLFTLKEYLCQKLLRYEDC